MTHKIPPHLLTTAAAARVGIVVPTPGNSGTSRSSATMIEAAAALTAAAAVAAIATAPAVAAPAGHP